MSHSPNGRRRKTRDRRARLTEGRRVRIHTTVGELIAAAFDAVGNEVRGVARLVSSPALLRSSGVRIVLV